LLHDAAAALFGDLKTPKLGQASYTMHDSDDVFLALSPEDLKAQVPGYDTRRALIAKDSLASVEGFRVMVLLAYKHLFGMRVCPNCPHCNHDDSADPCQDCFGSNAKSEGGIFGRDDAGYTSFEAQKSTGALHAHSQLFVQCLHQHEPLSQVLTQLTEKPELVERYMQYKAHVSRQMFAEDGSLKSWEEGRRKEVESVWPEYAAKTELLETPAYTLETSADYTNLGQEEAIPSQSFLKTRLVRGRVWLRQYSRIIVLSAVYRVPRTALSRDWWHTACRAECGVPHTAHRAECGVSRTAHRAESALSAVYRIPRTAHSAVL